MSVNSRDLDEETIDDVEMHEEELTVPQIKVGPDGQIMLDPKRLIIEKSRPLENKEAMSKLDMFKNKITCHNKKNKQKRTRNDWSPKETLQFYKALNSIGSDFSLMVNLFPNRTRRELKLKFKREEKVNMNLVDKAMKQQTDYDFYSLQKEIKQENEELKQKQLDKLLDKVRGDKVHQLNSSKLKSEEANRNRLIYRGKLLKTRFSAFQEFSIDERRQFYEEKPKFKPLFTKSSDGEYGNKLITTVLQRENVNETDGKFRENVFEETYISPYMLFGSPQLNLIEEEEEERKQLQVNNEIIKFKKVEETVFSDIGENKELLELDGLNQSEAPAVELP